MITQFPGTEMYDPGFNITSHGASHHGASHSGQNYDAHFQQGKYWAEPFAYLLLSLRNQPCPLGGGSMLDPWRSLSIEHYACDSVLACPTPRPRGSPAQRSKAALFRPHEG